MSDRKRSDRPSLCFLLPAGSDRISGGNLYNLGLLSALERLTVVERSSSDTLPARLGQGAPGIYLLDTLDLDRAPSLGRRARGQHFGLLVHHLPSLEPGSGLVARELELEHQALSGFDFFVATSEFTRALLIARGIGAERVLVVPPGAPALAAERAPRVLGGAPFSTLHALVVGNLIPRKALLEWLSALLPALRDEDDFTLVSIGRSDLDPTYAVACQAFAGAHPGLARRVRFRGEVPPAEMAESYAGASLLVSASGMETFGIALQEARAFGVPILALDRGNAREHVQHGVNGMLATSLGELATSFLDLVRRPPRLRALRDVARASATPGESWDAIAARALDQLAALAAKWW
jgi:glycosyltransferase involved in cell wall biosynthesis